MSYPCDCKDMRWMIDNNKVFKKENDVWFLSWIELDRTDDGKMNKENFGIRVKYCNFCGKRIGQN